jgi:hypothetical protein
MAPQRDQERQRSSWFGRLRNPATPAPTVEPAGMSAGELNLVLALENTGRSIMEDIRRHNRMYGTTIGLQLSGSVQSQQLSEETMPTVKKTPIAHPFMDKYPADKFDLLERPGGKVQSLYCCGIKEFHGVQNDYVFYNKAKDRTIREPIPVGELVNNFFEKVLANTPHRPLWIFSDNDKKKQPGEALAKYIEENDLGTVVRSGYARNFNSGCDVQCYVATIKPEAAKHRFK